MSKGFVFCAVVCSALALAVYAGLFQSIGVSATAAVFVLFGLCLLFHGVALYTLNPGNNTRDDPKRDLEKEEGPIPGTHPRKKAEHLPAGPPGDRELVPLMTFDGAGRKNTLSKGSH